MQVPSKESRHSHPESWWPLIPFPLQIYPWGKSWDKVTEASKSWRAEWGWAILGGCVKGQLPRWLYLQGTRIGTPLGCHGVRSPNRQSTEYTEPF